jgi:hypothetical protein
MPPGGQVPDATARAPEAGRLADRLLDVVVVAFATWTVVYHLCVVLRISAPWAVAAWVVLLTPATRFALGRPKDQPQAGDAGAGAPAWPRVRPGRAALNLLSAATVGLGVLAAVLFAFSSAPWVLVWLSWVVAAACAVAWTTLRPASGSPAPDGPRDLSHARPWLEPAVAWAWALGLAVFSLFLVGPDGDDAYYVHLASWIGAHGVFPLRDVVFSDQVFPALYFPPASSYEALVGALAHATGIQAAGIVYLGVPPLASLLAVLALWRLLRTWRVPMVALALSISLLFLLFAATDHKTLGAFFIARMWQGKVLFLGILVPLLLVLLQSYAERPTRRALALLACAGVAGVGLTTTAMFVIPVIATACLAPLALRSLRRAAAGLAVTAAYPLAAGVLTLAVGGRQPEVYTQADVIPGNLVHLVLGTGGLALLAVAALLVAPLLLRRASTAQMVAATVLLVGCLFAPRVPGVIFDLTGLGRVLWRLTWVMPTAALIGTLATGLLARERSPLVRALPAVVVGVAIVLAGTPLWSAGGEVSVAQRPSWKQPPRDLADARAILAAARAGDVILAPRPLSITLLAISGDVTTVSPRGFYTSALHDVPTALVPERQLLQEFGGIAARRRTGPLPAAADVRSALHAVGVDIVCLPKRAGAARRIVADAGYDAAFAAGRFACMRS